METNSLDAILLYQPIVSEISLNGKFQWLWCITGDWSIEDGAVP